MKTAPSQPAHSEDPVPKNPFAAQDPRHRVWAKATRDAHIDLHALKQRVFEKPSIADQPLDQMFLSNIHSLQAFNRRTRERQQSNLVESIFEGFQIWAKRALSVVRDEQDVRDYERWLQSHRDGELRLWTEKCPDHFDSVSFLAVLRKQLNRAYEYWIGNALKKVAELEEDFSAVIQEACQRTEYETQSMGGSPQRKNKPGPKQDRESAQRIREIVTQIASADSWKRKLDDICEALDNEKIPWPKTWSKREPPIGNWIDAAVTDRDLAKKAIEYRLKIAQN